jgi:hypothetical protein
MNVYLSGPISGCTFKGASDWRDGVAGVLRGAGFGVRDPLRGKSFLSNQKKYANIDPSTYEPLKRPDLSDKALVNRDHSDIVESGIVLVNLIDAKRVSIGTMFELAWAMHLRRHAVIVMEPEGNLHDHPFVREAGVVFPDLDNAINYILSCKSE